MRYSINRGATAATELYKCKCEVYPRLQKCSYNRGATAATELYKCTCEVYPRLCKSEVHTILCIPVHTLVLHATAATELQ